MAHSKDNSNEISNLIFILNIFKMQVFLAWLQTIYLKVYYIYDTNSSLDKKSVKIGIVVVYKCISMCTYFTIALFTGLIPVGPQCEKTCLRGFQKSETETSIELERLARIVKFRWKQVKI